MRLIGGILQIVAKSLPRILDVLTTQYSPARQDVTIANAVPVVTRMGFEN